MDAIIITAIATAFKAAAVKTAKAGLDVGEHCVNVQLAFNGWIRRGVDYLFTPTVKLPMLAIMTLLLHRSGFMGKVNATMMRQIISDAYENGDALKEAFGAMAASMERGQDTLAEIIGELPMERANGKVTSKITVTEVAQLVEA